MSVYLEAVKVLEERGWHQGGYHGPDGAVCVQHAIDIAAGSQEDRYESVYAVLERDFDWPEAEPIGWWNDDPSTSYEDVVLALKKAHELSEAGA